MDDTERSEALEGMALAAAFNEAAVAVASAPMPYRALGRALAPLAGLLGVSACAVLVDEGSRCRCVAAFGLSWDEPDLHELNAIGWSYGSRWSVPLSAGDGVALGSLQVFEQAPAAPAPATVSLARSYAAVIALGLERLQHRSPGPGRLEGVIAALTCALDTCDEYTARHSEETSDLAARVAKRLGVDRMGRKLVFNVASLHDVGKLGIPTQILQKPGPLTKAEQEIMRRHPVIGERILRAIPELAEVAKAIRHEHERWDGAGYPDGLSGEEIPLASRIVLACDAWHAMTSDRPYRAAMERHEAVRELRRCAGSQFDPMVARALLEELGEPAGTLAAVA